MPPAIVSRHLAAMLSGPLSVPVVFGSITTSGLYDHDATLIEDAVGEVKRESRVVIVRTGVLTNAKQNSRITVDGTSYEIRQVLPMEDGSLTRYLLAPV